MAPSRRSTGTRSSRARVSYRESSLEEEFEHDHSQSGDEFAPVPILTRSKRTRASNPKQPDPRRKSTHVRRSTRISYKEPSSEDSLDDEGSNEVESAHEESNTRRPLRRTKRLRTVERICPSKPAKPAKPVQDIPKPLESDGAVMPWATLPYEILLQIMAFASYPLHDDNFSPTPSVSWLLNTARVCKSFAEPALTALYRSPPLLTVDKPHTLMELLSSGGQPAEPRMFNYNVKIKRLELDHRVLAYTAPNRGLFDLGSLIPLIPQLSELLIYNHYDKPYLRTLHKIPRWNYPESLFNSMYTSGQRLRSWRWNGHLTGKTQTLRWMEETHRSQSFQSLRELTFTNYGTAPKLLESPSQGTPAELLAAAISALPELKNLTFETSPIVDEKFLPLLPTTLVGLVIDNCASLTSEALQAFLITHGSHIKTLVLNHNQSLDVSFLPDLRRSCPRLRVLKMDLKYYNSHATHDDSDPKFEDLLKPEEVPTWPPTLQTLEMIHLRNWSSAAAETFFGSLLDTAQELPDLRRLVLKAILNIGWRDRAKFRDEWIGKLQAVFLRRSPPPNPHLRSLRAFRSTEGSSSNASPSGPRTLGHVELAPLEDGPRNNEATPDTEQHPRSMTQVERRSTPNGDSDWGAVSRRLRPRTCMSAEGLVNTEPIQADLSEPIHVQGLCEVVDINIDNLRPREEQYNENDFLDSEASGDEDWNGTDDMPGGERYAW